MRATSPGGGPLASHTFTVRDVAENLLEYTGQNATDIKVVTNCEAILEFEPDIRAGGGGPDPSQIQSLEEPVWQISVVSSRRSIA